MYKLKVCLIFGGASFEHEVSILSAYNVAKNLDRNKYELIIIRITKNGRWIYCGDNPKEILNKNWEAKEKSEAIISPSTSNSGIIKLNGNSFKEIKIDVVFPIMHGNKGEDGTIQGLFELRNIPYVGSGVIGSSVCMDKVISKIILKNIGIEQVEWVQIKSKQKIDYDLLERKIGYSNFVKPANSGSSLGISKSNTKEELISNIKNAFKYDNKILVEKAIQNPREIECAVIGNESPIVSNSLGEILPCNEFYDYEAKYEKDSKTIVPIMLNEKISEKIKENAILAYKECECKGMARVDFLLDEEKVYLSEINTIPGFTDISMFAKLWKNDGLEMPRLLDKLIEFALK
ncbi:MAG: D-alanine--D-alanine ligase [Clostridiales bacterium]|jgi:D-alanine-D-alanine ligase|nr:D-alanine--D-alanine ligase [Clostridiales bacterium]